MPPKQFKSISVPDEVYEDLSRLADKWEADLAVTMSPGKVVGRLLRLHKEKEEVSYTEK